LPRAEIEGEMGDSHMGLQARLMSQALRKLTAAINRSRTSMIFINQIRMKMAEDDLLKTLPIVIISTEGSKARIEELLNKGVKAYIRKPFTPEVLRDVM